MNTFSQEEIEDCLTEALKAKYLGVEFLGRKIADIEAEISEETEQVGEMSWHSYSYNKIAVRYKTLTPTGKISSAWKNLI